MATEADMAGLIAIVNMATVDDGVVVVAVIVVAYDYSGRCGCGTICGCCNCFGCFG